MPKKIITTEITVVGNKVAVILKGDQEYISLTDLAALKAGQTEARTVVSNWMSNYFTIDYLSIWEELNNPSFNRLEFQAVRNSKGRLFISPSIWQKQMHASGIISKSGRYGGGTFAHTDIAFEFASWLSPEFKLYLIKEFERLKKDEAYRQKIIWSAHREIAKTNYLIHTQAIRDNIAPTLTERQKHYVYADEADMLNVVLFGITAGEWRKQNSDSSGNIRDYASDVQLKILINLENTNAQLIKEGKSQQERIVTLSQIAKEQMTIFNSNFKKKSKVEALSSKTKRSTDLHFKDSSNQRTLKLRDGQIVEQLD